MPDSVRQQDCSATPSRYRGWLQALLFPAIVAAAVAIYWAAVDRNEAAVDLEQSLTGDRFSEVMALRPLEEQEEAVREGALHRVVATKEPVSAEDLARIVKLPGLKSLTIGVFQGSQADLALLAEATALDTFHLHVFPVDDLGAASLAKAESLGVLNLDSGAFGDEGLASLANLPKLELLRFRSPEVGDAGIEALARRANGLKHLHVLEAKLTDASLEKIASMERLESFYVDGVEFSDDAWRKFLAARPDVHVHVDELHLPEDPQSRIKHE